MLIGTKTVRRECPQVVLGTAALKPEINPNSALNELRGFFPTTYSTRKTFS